MMHKEIMESLRIVIPIVIFVIFSIYILTSDSTIVGPF